MLRLLTLVIFIVLLVLAILFTWKNAHTVHIDYFIGAGDVPLALLLVSTLAVGAVIGIVAMLKIIMGLRFEVARLRKNVKLSEKEISNLRSLPVKEPR
jgi:putative membrane protein